MEPGAFLLLLLVTPKLVLNRQVQAALMETTSPSETSLSPVMPDSI